MAALDSVCEGEGMSWEEDLFALFDDLEQQAGALYEADKAAEIADRSRAEYRQVTLAARLAATVGVAATISVDGVGAISGTVERVADGWLLLAAAHHDWIVNLDAVRMVEGASVRAVPEVAWPATARLGLGSALRRLAEAGERCLLHLRDSSRLEGSVRRVGKDFCEFVIGADRRTVLVPFAALSAIQSDN